mgnify:CR=1 FL=1
MLVEIKRKMKLTDSHKILRCSVCLKKIEEHSLTESMKCVNEYQVD